MTLPATDDFNRADGGLGTNWTTVFNSGMKIYSNRCTCNTPAPNYDGAAGWNADHFAPDQYAQATYIWFGGGNGVGLAVRCKVEGGADDYLYGYYSDNSNCYLFKVVNGTFTTLGTGTKWSSNDAVRLEVRHTTLTPYVNSAIDSSIGAKTDTSITTGYPGVSGYGDDNNGPYIDNWQGSSLFGGIVQVKDATNDGYDEISVTLDRTPIQGNLLVACHFTGAADSTAPSGFSEGVALTDSGQSDQGAIYYRVAGSGESATITAGASAADENLLFVLELYGPWESSPLDKYANAGPTDGISAIPCGTTGTTSQADEVAVAMVTRRTIANDTPSWSESFIHRHKGNSPYKHFGVGSKLLTATGTVTTTATYLGTARCMGGLATFKKLGDGATQYQSSVAGAITPSGAVARQAQTAKVGELSPAGAVAKQINKQVGAY